MILPGGVVERRPRTLVLLAEQALGIAALRRCLGRGDGAGVLLPLERLMVMSSSPVGGGGRPLLSHSNADNWPDVVRVLTEAVEPVRGLLRVGPDTVAGIH